MLFRALRKQMKGVFILIIVAFAGSLLYAGGSSMINRGNESRQAGSPVAEVNGKKVTYGEFQQAYLSNLQSYQQFVGRLNGAQMSHVKFITLQQLVDQHLLLQLANREKVKVSNKEVDERLKDLKDRFPTKEEYQELLKANGLTEGKLRDLIREGLLVERLQEQKSQVTVTDEEVAQAYEQVQARHILFRADPNNETAMAAALKKANDVLGQIRRGEDFAALAKRYSDDAGSSQDGGDVGWFSRNDPFVQSFKDAAFALNVNQVSEPVKTEFGYHLIQVTGRKEASGEAFEKEKAGLREELSARKGSEAFRAWFDDQRAKASINILDPEMRAIQFVRNNQLPQAVAQYQEAIAKEPENPYLHLMLGQVYEDLGDLDRAVAEYQRALEKGGDGDPEIYLTLGNAYRKQKHTDRAIAAFQKASELDPMNAQLHVFLESIFTEMGRADLAKAEQNKLAEIQKVMLERQLLLEQQQQQQQQQQQSKQGK